jgi:hypothetical protein
MEQISDNPSHKSLKSQKSQKSPKSLAYTIRLKTLDNSLHDLEFDPYLPIHDLKLLISSKLRIPYNRQRLIYQGKLLLNQDILKEMKVKSRSVIHLVGLPPNLNQ